MTYSSGGLIQATDYNGFVSTTSGANINDIWGTGSGDKGWGQTALGTTSTGSTVTATQWASLVNTMSSAGSQTGTTLTARTAPTAGTVIGVLAAVNTDLTNITTNRGNAVGLSAISSTWSGSTAKTTATGSGGASWTITFTHTVTFPSADQARYFWNAGGLVVLDMNKSSTGTDNDPDWNTFIGTVGALYMSGRVNGASQLINGGTYTGFTKASGSGTPSPYASTTGWYSLTAGAAATTMFQLNDTVSPYTGDYVRVTAAKNAGATAVTFVTTWFSAGDANPGASTNISGGTDTASGGGFGTAPAVRCRFYTPSTTYLTNTWGTPSVAASVA
jgi:hypothetical protein